jgi:hypothetical protein
MAFLPAALSFRFGLAGSDVAFAGGVDVFAFPEDACERTASFTRATAAFASRSAFRMWSALDEYRSVTPDINASILASRLRALFAFMTTPLGHVWQWSESYRQNDGLAFQSGTNLHLKTRGV